MYHKITKTKKLFTAALLLTFCAFTSTFMLTSCEKDDDGKKEDVKLPEYIVLDQNLGDQIDYAILGLDGSGYFYEFQDERPNTPQRLSIYDGNKNNVDLIINFDEDGLPKNILSENFTIILGKYEGNKFSAVVITKEGESQIFENIETDVSWDEYKNGISDGVLHSSMKMQNSESTSKSSVLLRSVVQSVNQVVGAVGCGLNIAAITGTGGVAAIYTGGLAVISCGGVIANLGQDLGLWPEIDIIEDVGTIANYADLMNCTGSLVNKSEILECVFSLGEWVSSLILDRLDSATGDINLGEGVLKTGNGNVKLTLAWDNYADIDLHCIDPSGAHIYYANRYSPTGGFLDYDNTVAYGPENIYFSPAPVGEYRVYLHYYAEKRGVSSVNYKVAIFKNGSGQIYEGIISGQGSVVEISTFTIGGANQRSNTLINSTNNIINWNNLPKK